MVRIIDDGGSIADGVVHHIVGLEFGHQIGGNGFDVGWLVVYDGVRLGVVLFDSMWLLVLLWL